MIGYLTHNYSLIHAFQPSPVRRTRGETLALNRVFKTAPKLSDYFREDEILAVKGELERPISGLATDSRRVVPGNVFFALPGRRADGISYVDEAISRGAVAIVAQKIPPFTPAKVTFIRVGDARQALALVAQRYYKFPDRDMTVIGVTGTSGKTTVAHILKHFLNGDQRVGLLGTISYELGHRTVPSYQTTPGSLDVYGLMAQMRDAGCKHAVMEVSSHGIDQQRVRGVHFGAAVFTNLSSDHLDYHQTLADYFEVKARLFNGSTGAPPKVAVVNLDDLHGAKLVAKISQEVPGARVVTFGEDTLALVRAENVQLTAARATFKLIWPQGEMLIDSPLVGRYNVSNLLAAIATAWSLGRDPFVFLAKLRALKDVPGRLERIDEGQRFNVLVDYAHTEDALRNALGMLRAITPGKVRVVFGCGGNRDRTKRPLMVRAVQATADHAYATADNPRTEAIGQIFDDMKTGVTAPDHISWIADRRRAISDAIEECEPGDSLLIAGKGHEIVQECADTVFPFDDRQVARELLRSKLTTT